MLWKISQQPGTKWEACKKVFSCCQARAMFCLWSG